MRVLTLSLLLALVSGCSTDDDKARARPDGGSDSGAGAGEDTQNVPTRYARDELMKPDTCKDCHPKHYREWASSMHAYASLDPVFRAMNQRGQRETSGQLGKFCVQCHAPMALREGLTADGLNLAQVPAWAQGVTCYFCHNAVDVGPDHFNASLVLANDATMRGNLRDPVDPGVHGVASSEFHDNLSMKSSILCGACHDVVNGKNVHIERTLQEYKDSILSIERSGKAGGDSCQGCHMPASSATDYAASISNLKLRKRELHEHRWAAVDVALTDFPDREEHERATECELTDGAFIFQISSDGVGGMDVLIETSAGHAQPSGTAQDRRLWLQFIAYDEQGAVLLQSGVIADGEFEERLADDPQHDTQLCMMRDRFFDEAGKEVHMFWEAASYEANVIPFSKDRLSNHVRTCRYQVPGFQEPARVEIAMRMRPVGMDVLQSLIDSGDLDPAIAQEMPTFTLHSTVVEWKPEDGRSVSLPTAKPLPITCRSPG